MTPRWWWPYALASMAVALSSWSLWHSYHTARDAAVVHRLAAAEPASPSWYANQRGANRFFVTDPFAAGGAVGDDSHDDTAALQAAITNAQAVNGVVVLPAPTVAYKTTSEVTVSAPIRILGEGSNWQHVIIRAHASMRSVLQVRTITNPITNIDWGTSKGLVDGVTLDANLQARHALLMNDAEDTRVSNVRVINALYACIRAPRMILPVTLGSVTVSNPGGSPSGVTFSVSDPNFYFANGSTNSDTLQVKVIGTGALGSGTYALSINSGAFYPTALPIRSTVNLVNEDGSGFVQSLLGVQVSFPSGTYHTNDTYTTTATSTLGDQFSVNSASDFALYDGVTFGNCGQVFSTTALASHFNGYQQHTIAGTATATSGSQFITGSSTGWMSSASPGYGRGVIQIANGGTVYPYVAILDDQDIALVHGTEPLATLSGQDYAFTSGGGYYEDGSTEGQEVHFLSPIVGDCATCFQFANGLGGGITHGNMNTCALAGVVAGAGSTDQAAAMRMESLRASSGAAAYGAVPYMISPYSSGTMIEPFGNFSIGGVAAGNWVVTYHGLQTPLGALASGSWIPSETAAYIPSSQSITSAAQTITVPDGQLFPTPSSPTTGTTTYIRLTSNADYLMTAAPIIAPIQQKGLLVILQNDGFNVITLQTDAITSSGLLLKSSRVSMQRGDTIGLLSNGVDPFHQYYRELFESVGSYGTINGGHIVGNTGVEPLHVVTTNATPVSADCWAVSSGVGAYGTVKVFDVVAESQTGANVGAWLGYQWGLTSAGTEFMWVAGTQAGSGAGGVPPLSWAIGRDTAGATRCLKLTGDSSANPVAWTIIEHHRDPGQ